MTPDKQEEVKKASEWMNICINIGSYTFQIIPEKDLCFIFKNGFPIWGGNKDQLIEIFEELQK